MFTSYVGKGEQFHVCKREEMKADTELLGNAFGEKINKYFL